MPGNVVLSYRTPVELAVTGSDCDIGVERYRVSNVPLLSVSGTGETWKCTMEVYPGSSSTSIGVIHWAVL
ncbi:hypothetical protein AB205_0116370 [Aquarana catesbeiana]|uniref:Uncharacterized protein n=1 Tax=Aquarana catesbeiana TaxID=8400 RepID=A0A2G9SHT5_AQUCT|nr:hypothetical protein AB205_0116370 [Aquarana catesbeiana]